MLYRLSRRIIRLAVTAFQTARRSVWRVTTPERQGVHGIAFTPTGEVILVRLTYARGWRLPGGGIKRGESHEAAVLRELQQEIGMTGWCAIRSAAPFSHRPDHKRSFDTLFVLHDVAYRPRRWSLEVEEVGAFPLDRLPADIAPVTAKMLAAAGFR